MPSRHGRLRTRCEFLSNHPGCSIQTGSFLDRLSFFLPHGRLLSPHDPVNDPFLRCCILDYVFAGSRSPEADVILVRRNQAILRHNLGCLDSSNPSPSVMLGLFVLSMKPLDPAAARFERHMDGPNHIGRAVSIALSFGLPDAPATAQRSGAELLLEGASDLLLSRCLLVRARRAARLKSSGMCLPTVLHGMSALLPRVSCADTQGRYILHSVVFQSTIRYPVPLCNIFHHADSC